MTTSISIYCPKGGTGRTTLAVHLADFLALRGARLLLRDADPQGSALGWAFLADQVRDADHGGPLPFTVGRGLAEGYDIVLTDHGPTEAGLSLPTANLFIIVPVSLDGVSQAVGLRELARLKAEGHSPIVVASKYRPDRAEHREALSSEALAGAIVIRDRACLAGWYATGRTIYDPAHGRNRGVALAREDINAVGQAVMARLAAAEPSATWLRDFFTTAQEG
jgi:chromosome partitioning protein